MKWVQAIRTEFCHCTKSAFSKIVSIILESKKLSTNHVAVVDGNI